MKQEKLSGWLGAVKRLARPLAIAIVLGVGISGVGVPTASALSPAIKPMTTDPAYVVFVNHPAQQRVEALPGVNGSASFSLTHRSVETTFKLKTTVGNGGKPLYVCRDVTTMQTRVTNYGRLVSAANTESVIDRDGTSQVIRTNTLGRTKGVSASFDASTNTLTITHRYSGQCSNNVDVRDSSGRMLWGTAAIRATIGLVAEAAVTLAIAAFIGYAMASIAPKWFKDNPLRAGSIAFCIGGAAGAVAMGWIAGSVNRLSDNFVYAVGGCVTSTAFGMGASYLAAIKAEVRAMASWLIGATAFEDSISVISAVGPIDVTSARSIVAGVTDNAGRGILARSASW